jgi:uncharacterized protein with HEPN domain
MQTKDRILLRKILEEIEIIDIVIAQSSKEEFADDKVRQHAVVMALLNCGELARNLDDTMTATTPGIPWKQVVGLRNVAAHGYASLSMPDIWKTITEDVPLLKKSVDELLASNQ